MNNLDYLLKLPTMRGFEARRGLTQAAHAICSALNLPSVSVEFKAGTQTASMSSFGTLTLADIDDDARVGRAQFHRWVGYVVHELLHRKYTDFQSLAACPLPERRIHNAIEDAWIERRAIQSGLLGNVRGLLKTLIDSMVEESLEAVSDWGNPSQYPWSLAVYARGFAKRVPVCRNLLPIWQEAARRIDGCQSTADTVALAHWVCEQMAAAHEEAEKEEQPGEQGDEQGDEQSGKGQGEGQGEEGPGEASGEGAGAGDEQGEGDGEGQGGEASGEGEEEPEDAGLSRSGGGPARQIEPTMTASGRPGYGTYHEAAGVGDGVDAATVVIHKAVATIPGRLRLEVRRVFENSATEDHQRGRRAGSVDTRSLASVATGNVRVFKRRLEEEGVDSAVLLLLDISQSMFDDHLIDSAVATTIALADTLTAAGVDVCVATFGDNVNVLSPFGKPVKRCYDTLRRLFSGGSTNDYFAVRYCHDLLLRHDAGRRVLFVMTDGDGDFKGTRHQIAVGTRLGITTVGVGLQRDVSPVFDNHMRIDDIANMGSAVFNKIKVAA